MDTKAVLGNMAIGHTVPVRMDDGPPRPAPLLHMSRAQRMRQQQAAAGKIGGVEFDLPASGFTEPALVKRHIGYPDMIAAGVTPTFLQDIIGDQLTRFLDDESDGAAMEINEKDVTREYIQKHGIASALRLEVEMNDAVCLAGFIDPPLVATKAEADANPNVMWVGELALSDRAAYAAFSMGAVREDAKAVEPFPEEPAAAVEPVPDGEDLRPVALDADAI